MSFKRMMMISGFAVASSFMMLPSATAAALPAAALGDIARAGTAPLVDEVQYRGRGGRHMGGPRGGGPRYYGRRGGGRGVGAGVAAGVIGGLIGGALLNSQRPAYAAPYPVYEEPVYVAPRGGGAVEYCMRRFRSYDPRTGTYMGYDGVERACP